MLKPSGLATGIADDECQAPLHSHQTSARPAPLRERGAGRREGPAMTTGVITPAGEGVIITTGQMNDRGKLLLCHLSNCYRTVTKQ